MKNKNMQKLKLQNLNLKEHNELLIWNAKNRDTLHKDVSEGIQFMKKEIDKLRNSEEILNSLKNKLIDEYFLNQDLERKRIESDLNIQKHKPMIHVEIAKVITECVKTFSAYCINNPKIKTNPVIQPTNNQPEKGPIESKKQ